MNTTTPDANKKKEEEKKKGGVVFSLDKLQTLQRGMSSMGAGGASAAATQALIGKIAVALLVGIVGSSAVGISKLNKATGVDNKAKFGSIKRTRADKPKYDDVDPSKLATRPAAASSLPGVVEGDMSGKTEAQKAQEAAEAAAAQEQAEAEAKRKAEEEAQAKAAEEQAKAAAAAAAAGSANASASAPANMPTGPVGGGAKLSGGLSGLGGGGGGGGGGSGARMSAASAGASTGFSKDMKGGIARGGSPARGLKMAGATRSFRQLQASNQLSRSGAAAGGTEAGSASASNAFGGHSGAGSPIGGGGAGITGPGVFTGKATTSGSGGGPMGGGGAGGGTEAAPEAQGKDDSPWKGARDRGLQMMLAAIGCITAAILIKKFADLAGPYGQVWKVAMYGLLAAAALAIGIVAMSAIQCMTQGGWWQGASLALGAAGLGFACYQVAFGDWGTADKALFEGTGAWATVLPIVGTVLGVGGTLLSDSGSQNVDRYDEDGNDRRESGDSRDPGKGTYDGLFSEW
jgi:hypothetical protein